jgi:hypothetical protein
LQTTIAMIYMNILDVQAASAHTRVAWCPAAGLTRTKSAFCNVRHAMQHVPAPMRSHSPSVVAQCVQAALHSEGRCRHAGRCQAAAAQQAPNNPAAEDSDGDVCLPPDISIDNDSHKEYSVVTIEVNTPHSCSYHQSLRTGLQSPSNTCMQPCAGPRVPRHVQSHRLGAERPDARRAKCHTPHQRRGHRHQQVLADRYTQSS